MADTGIVFRKGTKVELEASRPVAGEIVFATTTGEHGWLNENGALVWKKLNADTSAFVTAPSGVLPVLNGSNLTNLNIDTSAFITAPSGVLPVLNGSNLTNLNIDTSGAIEPMSDDTAFGTSGTGNFEIRARTKAGVTAADKNYHFLGQVSITGMPDGRMEKGKVTCDFVFDFNPIQNTISNAKIVASMYTDEVRTASFSSSGNVLKTSNGFELDTALSGYRYNLVEGSNSAKVLLMSFDRSVFVSS